MMQANDIKIEGFCNWHHIYIGYIKEGSDLEKLEILQGLLINLDVENFVETRNWILNSIFCNTEEGIHDLIYFIFLISSARNKGRKIKVFSRLIISLFEISESNNFLKGIPNQIIGLLPTTDALYVDDIIQDLILSSIITSSDVERILSRKKIHYDREHMFDTEINYMLSQRFIYPHFDNNGNEIAEAISEDDANRLEKLLACYHIYDFDYKFDLTFKRWSCTFSMLDYAAFNGSSNCFKLLLYNDAKICGFTVDCACCGGCVEIIKILDEKKCDLVDRWAILSASFNNEIFDWIVHKNEVKLDFSYKLDFVQNIHVLRFISKNYGYIDGGFLLRDTQSIILLKHFIENSRRHWPGDDAEKASLSSPFFFMACMYGDLEIIKFLINMFGHLVNRYHGCLYPFQAAFLENQIDVLELLSQYKGIRYHDCQLDLFAAAIKLKLFDSLKILLKINGIGFGEEALREAICSDDEKIFEIILKHEFIRKCFDLKKSIDLCIEYNCMNSFRCLILYQIDRSLKCIEMLFENLISDDILGFIKIVLEDNFYQRRFKNRNELATFLFKESCVRANRRVSRYLVDEMKIKIDDEVFVDTLTKCIEDRYEHHPFNRMDDWLVLRFPSCFERNKYDILRFCRNSFYMKFVYHHIETYFNELPDDEIFDMFLEACKERNTILLKRYQKFLPEFINIEENRETLLAAGQRFPEVIEILLKVPNID